MILNNLKILRPYISDNINKNQVFFDEEMDDLFSVYEEKDEYDYIVESEGEKYHYASECEDLVKSLDKEFEDYFAIGSYNNNKIIIALKEDKIELWELQGKGRLAVALKIFDITKNNKKFLENLKEDIRSILDADKVMRTRHNYLLNVALNLLKNYEFKEIKRYKNRFIRLEIKEGNR